MKDQRAPYTSPEIEIVPLETVYADKGGNPNSNSGKNGNNGNDGDNGKHKGWKSGFVAPGQQKKKN